MVAVFNQKKKIFIDGEDDWCCQYDKGQKASPETNQNILGGEDSVSSETAFYYYYYHFDETKALQPVSFGKTKKEKQPYLEWTMCI